jgi:hypothetical protein
MQIFTFVSFAKGSQTLRTGLGLVLWESSLSDLVSAAPEFPTRRSRLVECQLDTRKKLKFLVSLVSHPKYVPYNQILHHTKYHKDISSSKCGSKSLFIFYEFISVTNAHVSVLD